MKMEEILDNVRKEIKAELDLLFDEEIWRHIARKYKELKKILLEEGLSGQEAATLLKAVSIKKKGD